MKYPINSIWKIKVTESRYVFVRVTGQGKIAKERTITIVISSGVSIKIYENQLKLEPVTDVERFVWEVKLPRA